MQKAGRTVALVAVTVVWAAPFSAAATADYRPADITDALEAFVGENSVPGATLAIGDAQTGVIVTFSAGLADLERNEAMMPDSRMPAGSVGKMLVAALAVSLVRNGLLSLDTPISDWLADEDWFAQLPNGPNLTLRMLLSHTSGIPDHVDDPDYIDAIQVGLAELARRPDADDYLSPLELIGFVLGDAPTGPAGQSYRYSDTNYVVVGLLMEKATGLGLDVLLTRFLIEPIGLAQTEPAAGRSFVDLAAGYAGANSLGFPEKVADQGTFAFNPWTEYAGGGLITTAGDLARWMLALVGGTSPIGIDGARLMIEGGGRNYGLGIAISTGRFGPTVGHTGEFPGYRTSVVYFQELGLAVAVQVNSYAQLDLSALIKRVVDIIIGADVTQVSDAAICAALPNAGLAGHWAVTLVSGDGRPIAIDLVLTPAEADTLVGEWSSGAVTWTLQGRFDGTSLTLSSVGPPAGPGAEVVPADGVLLTATQDNGRLTGEMRFLDEGDPLPIALSWTACLKDLGPN